MTKRNKLSITSLISIAVPILFLILLVIAVLIKNGYFLAYMIVFVFYILSMLITYLFTFTYIYGENIKYDSFMTIVVKHILCNLPVILMFIFNLVQVISSSLHID